MRRAREGGENFRDFDWFLLMIYLRTDAWMTSLSFIQNRFLVAMCLFSKRSQKKSIEGFRGVIRLRDYWERTEKNKKH